MIELLTYHNVQQHYYVSYMLYILLLQCTVGPAECRDCSASCTQAFRLGLSVIFVTGGPDQNLLLGYGWADVNESVSIDASPRPGLALVQKFLTKCCSPFLFFITNL